MDEDFLTLGFAQVLTPNKKVKNIHFTQNGRRSASLSQN
jgi:hypothetical protein